MSIDLERDLRTFVSYLQSVTEPEGDPWAHVDSIEISAHATPQPAFARRGVWVAAAAALLALVTLGLTALLSSHQPEPADTLTPSTLGRSGSSSWSTLPSTEGGLGDGVFRSVADGERGLVAVGGPGVWTSSDGIEWMRVPSDQFGGESVTSVVAGGPGWVAVGEGAWTSVDGISWTRVYDADGLEIRSVVVGGPGLVAVGEGSSVWTSVDGIAWSRSPHDSASFGGASDGDLHLAHVAVGGPGLVAVGADWSGPDADAAVWTSEDGHSWTRVPHEETVFGGSGNQLLTGVVAGGPGLVAVGSDRSESQRAAVWTSVDGLAWTRVPLDESGSLDGGQMNSVVVTNSGLVAVGWVGWVGGTNSEAAVWTSVDGIVWSRLSHNEQMGNGVIWDVVRTERGLIAVGESGTNGAVWIGPGYAGGER